MKMLTDHYQLRQAHAVNAPAPRCVKDIIEGSGSIAVVTSSWRDRH